VVELTEEIGIGLAPPFYHLNNSEMLGITTGMDCMLTVRLCGNVEWLLL
jgi:hypothetical protein